MRYKAVVYYPEIKDELEFSKDKFQGILDHYPQIDLTYVNTKSEFYNEINDADYIFSLKLHKDIYTYTTKLKAIFTCMAGRESIPESSDYNISYYFGSFHGRLVSETLLSSIMYFNQKFNLLNQSKFEKNWENKDIYGKRRLLHKQKVGILGYGSIGRYCAKYLSKHNIKVYAIQRSRYGGYCPVSGAEYVHVTDMNGVLLSLDHVVSLLPESIETNNIFNTSFFGKMKQESYFYNFGRGNAVNEDDLIEFLQKKDIAGAHLDVFKKEPLDKESKLWDIDNLLITPHISTYYDSYIEYYTQELKMQLEKEISKTTLIICPYK
jgi:phosphoglycerate dehydrogenase-like enzyme